MPNIGYEHGNVASLTDDGHHALALPSQVYVIVPIRWRRLAGFVATGNDACGPARERAILKIDVYRYDEYRVGNTFIPSNAWGPGNVRAGIDVPITPAVRVGLARWVAPASIGDDVAVFAEQRFDGFQYARVCDGFLRSRATVEHLVAKVFVFLWVAYRR